MKKIAVHGCYHNSNFGDLLMLDLLGRFVRTELAAVPLCPWQGEGTAEMFGLPRARGVLDCAAASGAIFGGGGYLHDGGGSASTRRLLRYSIPARIWRSLRIPYVVVGVGGGPTLSATGKRRVAYIANGARAVCVRDEVTRDLLVASGVPDGRIEVTADIVMSLVRDDIPNEARSVARAAFPREQPVRYLGLHFPKGDVELIVRAVAQGLKGHDDVEVVWIFDHGMANREKIVEASKRHLSRFRVQDFVRNPWQTAAFIGELDAVFTGKLHVGITAWALGVPTCGLSYHAKSGRFYGQIGRSDFHAEYGSDPGVVGEWAAMFARRANEFDRESAAARAELPQKALRNFAIVREHLSDRNTRL